MENTWQKYSSEHRMVHFSPLIWIHQLATISVGSFWMLAWLQVYLFSKSVCLRHHSQAGKSLLKGRSRVAVQLSGSLWLIKESSGQTAADKVGHIPVSHHGSPPTTCWVKQRVLPFLFGSFFSQSYFGSTVSLWHLLSCSPCFILLSSIIFYSPLSLCLSLPSACLCSKAEVAVTDRNTDWGKQARLEGRGRGSPAESSRWKHSLMSLRAQMCPPLSCTDTLTDSQDALINTGNLLKKQSPKNSCRKITSCQAFSLNTYRLLKILTPDTITFIHRETFDFLVTVFPVGPLVTTLKQIFAPPAR